MRNDSDRKTIAGILIRFSFPLILSGLLQQIFNWVDAFIVGNTDGELALAGIGATTSMYNLFVTVIVGATSGISVLAAQQYGKSNKAILSRILSSFSLLLGGVFLLIAALGIAFSASILTILDTPETIFHISRGYLQLVLIGTPFLAVYNTYSGVLRGLGDSRAPFLSVIVSSIFNVVLDVCFVIILHKGAPGAAAATALSQAFMMIFIILYTEKKYPLLRMRSQRICFDPHVLREGLKFLLPPAIQAGVSSMGSLFLQRFMNSFGEQTVAAITTAYRVDTVIMLPIVNFGSGIATIVAQNIGAGKENRAKQVLKIGAVMMTVTSLCLTLLVIIFGGPLIAMFGLTAESVAIGQLFFLSIGTFYIVYGLAMAVRGFIEGKGDLFFSGIMGILSLGVRIFASYGFRFWFDNMVVAYAEAFSWLFLLIVFCLRLWYYRLKK